MSLFIGPTGKYVNTMGQSGSEMKAEAPKKRTVIRLGSSIREDTLTKEIKALKAKKASLDEELKAVNTSLFAKEQELVKSEYKRKSMGIFRKSEKKDEEEYLKALNDKTEGKKKAEQELYKLVEQRIDNVLKSYSHTTQSDLDKDHIRYLKHHIIGDYDKLNIAIYEFGEKYHIILGSELDEHAEAYWRKEVKKMIKNA